ncbi:MAG TPA: 16S rRNA (guanine(527)-N(7))-methyltransferase RsmG [Pyrinomonadaceae bacterium]|nr:16S rRNA (guanine(527)-N(7))-methyltransferase RsmG [Pyrinomonadaceae bacterium]
MTGDTSTAGEFVSALRSHAPRYGVRLSEQDVSRLRDYYEHVNAWNARLHLVAPCSPTEFATRHVLESLLALPHLTPGARVADVGSGAGLPIIPCVILRPDIHATLIEASTKKAIFLREALRRLGAHNTASVIAERFERTAAPDADFITCRALERFAEMFAKLVAWSPHTSTLLLFGGQTLNEQIKKANLDHTIVHIPESERRFLFIVKRNKAGTKQLDA